MTTVKYLFSIIIATVLFSCSEPDTLIGFDNTTWKADGYGCLSNRAALAPELISRKSELMGLDSSEIKALLGKPDRIELYKRSQRFFLYFIEPGETCQNYQPKELVKNITIRFDALGRVKEVVLYD